MRLMSGCFVCCLRVASAELLYRQRGTFRHFLKAGHVLAGDSHDSEAKEALDPAFLSAGAASHQGTLSTNILDKIYSFDKSTRRYVAKGNTLADSVKSRMVAIVFGLLFFLISIPIQWFNEERSVRMDTLISRGLEECRSVDASKPNSSNRGKLVHVQGKACGALPVMDGQIKDACLSHCLKLQSTLEVFEWVQTWRAWQDGKEKRSQPRFHTEWTTIHHDSLRFRKPSPENPKLPSGLFLGTFTSVCRRVEIGSFVLADEMLNFFHKFEPAMKLLPDTVTAHGHSFYANREDGYYYMRPSASPLHPGTKLFKDPQVGDVRVRFMYVPEGEATVVAVQCKKDGCETFVPYRPIPRGPCLTDVQERQKLIEEGGRPLKDLKREITCCAGGTVSTCCCCPCNIIACCCTSEIVTEEIFYVSDRLDPVEKPFQWVVQRSPWRVWPFRLIGWFVMYLGVGMVLGPFSAPVRDLPGLSAYGGASCFVLDAMITLTASALIVAAAYMCYRPVMAIKWLLVVAIIIAVPLLWGTLTHKPH